MSRIGKIPVSIPGGVTVTVAGRKIDVKGPKGTLSIEHRPEVAVAVDSDAKEVAVTRTVETREGRAYHGLTRALVNNMIIGVTEGFKKELEVNGVGWGAKLQGRKVALSLGYADVRMVDIPQGVDVEINGNKVVITGSDKQAVGQLAAKCRAHRKPEPYNGKGVKYVDEQIIRKEGKAFAGGGGG